MDVAVKRSLDADFVRDVVYTSTEYVDIAYGAGISQGDKAFYSPPFYVDEYICSYSSCWSARNFKVIHLLPDMYAAIYCDAESVAHRCWRNTGSVVMPRSFVKLWSTLETFTSAS